MKPHTCFIMTVVTLLTLIMVAACGPSSTPIPQEPTIPATAPPESPATEPPEEAMPTQGEEMAGIPENIGTFAFSGANFEFDPSLVLSIDHNPALNVYEHLVLWDPDEGLIPGVAESWESNADATQWTFHIYEGVKCHDGTDFTTADVQFSVERTIEAGALAYMYTALDTIEIVDDHTIVFNMKYPHDLPNTFTDGWGQYMMCESVGDKPPEWFGQGNGIGTGPYKFESFAAGERLVL
jgi:ABC-type transport system substrate-binding protein